MNTNTTQQPAPSGAGAVVDVLALLVDADPAVRDRDGLDELVSGAQRVRSWLDAFDTRVAQRARQLAAAGRSESAGSVLANRGRRSQRDAEKAADRADVCDRMPGVQDALENGRLSAEHVDAIANASASLNDDQRAELAGMQDQLVNDAAAKPVEDFDRECRDLVRKLTREPGTSRNERNRENRNVRKWTDKQTGMCKTLLSLDAETNAAVWAAINAAVNAARAAKQDEGLTFDQLQVDALIGLITGARSVDPRVPEVSVLIDLQTLIDDLHDRSTCETADGQPLTPEAVRRLSCEARIIPIVLGGNGEVLDLGRSKRLASRAQRVALRAMYDTCGMPGCNRPFDQCQIHHVDEWKHDLGPTDLAKLIPVCYADHHLVHEGGWRIELDPDRTLRVFRPDGALHFEGTTTAAARRRADPPPAAVA